MLYLQNNGELEIECIKTMGINAKDTEGAIGFFGTGLKYAIAVFLREEVEFKLFIGDREFSFFTEEKQIRGKTFKFCKMQGFDVCDLGFTTELGKNWELWQAYREIHSNTLDEGGIITSEVIYPENGTTLFVLDVDDSLQETFLDTNKRRLLFTNRQVEIYEGESDHIYYQGIRAKDLHKPSVHTYNILAHCELTEDRSLAYDFQVERYITNALAECDREDVITTAVTSTDSNYEASIDASWDTVKPGATFSGVISGNLSSVSGNFQTYCQKHEPKPEMTKEEKRRAVLDQLEDICYDHDLVLSYSRGVVTIDGELLRDD